MQFLDKLSRPSLCYARCRFLSGQCAALPVETPQVQFLDEVLVITTGAGGLDNAQLLFLFKIVDFLIVTLRQFPVVLVKLPSCFSMVVDVPVVLMQQVIPCPWYFHRCGYWTSGIFFDDPDVSVRRIKTSFRKQGNSLSGLQLAKIQNVSVQRIEASFRKQGNSLSGLRNGEDPERFCAKDRGFLSGAMQFPFGFAQWRKGDPSISVRRIKASFRKRSSSLSGNLWSAPRVHQECTESAPGVHQECTRSAPEVHQESTEVHQECTRSAPGVHQNTPGVNQECTRSAPGVHQECTRNAPGVLGTSWVFLSSTLLFKTWRRRIPAWEPVGLLSSGLLS